jgi:hypothetical protein
MNRLVGANICFPDLFLKKPTSELQSLITGTAPVLCIACSTPATGSMPAIHTVARWPSCHIPCVLGQLTPSREQKSSSVVRAEALDTEHSLVLLWLTCPFSLRTHYSPITDTHTNVGLLWNNHPQLVTLPFLRNSRSADKKDQ